MGTRNKEEITPDEKKREELKKMLRRLHEANPEKLDAVKKEAEQYFKDTEPKELALAEQELIQEGTTREEMKRLCDVHLEVMKRELGLKAKSLRLPASHPISICKDEHKIIKRNLKKLKRVLEKIKTAGSFDKAKHEIDILKELSHFFLETDKHHKREEEAIFPRLIAHGVIEPPQIFKEDHVEFMAKKRDLSEIAMRAGKKSFKEFLAEAGPIIEFLAKNLEDHIYKEDNILYPMAYQTLEKSEWKDVRKKFDAIGYCCFAPADIKKKRGAIIMEEYLDKGIKELITKYPKVADILNEYNIGCVPCNIGLCLLKDIVEIHNLSLEDEEKLMTKIAKVIYPDRKVKIPKIKRKPPVKEGEITYSPPMKRLVDEHVLIKKWITLVPNVIENLDIESEEGRKIILDGVDFIRSYADKFHHAKEEEILFKYFDANLDIVKTILKDHDAARNHVKAIIEALEKRDKKGISEHLNGYRELLTEHIKKEDEILYPWMDRNLSITQVGELFTKFDEADQGIGEVVPRRCEGFIKNLEGKIERQKKEVSR